MNKRSLVVGLAAIGATWALPVRAQHDTLAEALFREARDAMRSQNFAVACPKLAESYRLDPSIGTLLNLAICEESRGRVATAWTTFHHVLDAAPSDDARTRLAEQHIRELEPKLPRIRVVLPSPLPDDARARLDGLELGAASLSTPLPVDPGEHRVTLSTANSSGECKVSVAVGQVTDCRLELKSGSATPDAGVKNRARERNDASRSSSNSNLAAKLARPEQPSRTLRTGAYVAAGLGLAALVTSVVFYGLALDEKATVAGNCDEQKFCNDAGAAAGNRGANYVLIGNVGLVVAATGLATGAVLFWQDARQTASRMPTGTFVAVRGTLP